MPSVESLCNAMARSHFLEADEIRSLRQRWVQESGPQAGDEEMFLRWLTARGTLTEYQAGVLQRDNVDQLFIGPYVIEDRIGKGRMAGVYRARHGTGAKVAIKVLPPSKAKEPQTLARFQREARLARYLQHPNIVRTFQTGKTGSLHYLVMEHLEGEPLDELFARRGPLPPAEAVGLVYQLLQGLEEIHTKSLVHRDIKPGNLMLLGGKPDSIVGGVVKILDIGTGRALFDEGPGDALTNSADLLGTPAYMSPEQARDPHGADIRSDIYSAGCVLYHALAGRPPFTDSNPVRLLVKVATEQPKPVKQFNAAVPDGLQQILNGMLVKDPAARYATPKRAAQAMQVFLQATEETVDAPDAPMKEFLGWLKTEVPDDEVNVEPVAPVARTVILSPPTPPTPIAVPVAPRVAVSRPNPQPAPPPPPAPPMSSRKPASRVPPPPPVGKPAKVKRRREEEEKQEPEQEPTFMVLSRRDFFLVLAGVLGLAVVVSLSLALYAIFRPRSQPQDEPPENKPPEE